MHNCESRIRRNEGSMLYEVGFFGSQNYITPNLMQKIQRSKSSFWRISAGSQESESTFRENITGSEKPASDPNTVIYPAIIARERVIGEKLVYHCHYSQMFGLALSLGKEHFISQLSKCFRLLKRKERKIDFASLRIVVKPREERSSGSILEVLNDSEDMSSTTVEEFTENEQNSYRAVFGELKEYNQLVVVKWVNNPHEYSLYERPAIETFQNMLNEKLIGQFNYTNRNPEFIASMVENLERIANGKEHFRYPFFK